MTWLNQAERRLWAGLALVGMVHQVMAKEVALEAGFRDPPPAVRTRVFWRVFGPAWERQEIDYQLRLLKAAGVGGVMTFFMYPVATDSDLVHNERFLSAEFLRDFAYAAKACHDLGLRFGVAGGTGWPFGGPTVPKDEAAQRLHSMVVPVAADGELRVPALGEDERLVAAFQGGSDLTERILRRGGKAPTASGSEPLIIYVAGPTGMRVKRPAFGGEGWVLDHYNATAARHYLDKVVAPMLEAAPGLVESIFCDSLEVYGANWTSDFPLEFSRRRHEELRPMLSDVFDSGSPCSPDARFAFWRTLSELTAEKFTGELSTWAHRHGVRLEMEAYGTPPNPLSAARQIDVPTGEQYEWRGFSLSRLAVSGAHLSGKRVIGAEAWTWLGLPNRLGDSLSDMKLASDLHFLAGVNDLTAVDFAYSPRSAGSPGWMPYYGPVLNQNNPQWPWFRHLMNYTSRCQWLLRQGRPVAEVALYLPVEDQFAFGPVDQMLLGFRLRDHFVTGEKTDEFGLKTALRHRSDLIATLLAQGFNYDGLDFFSLNTLANIRHGRLHCGDGDYGMLVLPRLVGIERRSLERMLAFARSGGTILVTGRWPERVYGGLLSRQSSGTDPLLQELSGGMGSPPKVTSRGLGRGRVVWVPDEQESLKQALAELRRDVCIEPEQLEVGVVHRRTGARDIYFFSNVGGTPKRFTAALRTGFVHAERWNPMTGTIEGLPCQRNGRGSMRVELELEPRGSTFVVCGAGAATLALERPSGFNNEPLKVTWTLCFEGSNAPATRSLSELVSWTTWPDAKFYSGRGIYTGQFVWNHPVPRRARLGFTQVAEVADVRLNGHDAGAIWIPPAEVEVSDLLRPGTNSLSVTVANLPLNGYLGAPDEDLGPLRAVFGDRFPAPTEKRNEKPAPSGLIGPAFIRFAWE